MSHLRLPITLVGALVLWLPTLSRLLAGTTDLLTAVGYFTAGLALVWIGVGMLARMVDRYAAENVEQLAAAEAEEVEEDDEVAELATQG